MREITSSTSASSRLSVSSSFRRSGLAPLDCSEPSTCSTKSGWRNCRTLTFTDRKNCRVSELRDHTTSCSQAPCSFGLVHRQVRVLEQLVHTHGLLAKQRNTDARGAVVAGIAQRVGLAQRGGDM